VHCIPITKQVKIFLIQQPFPAWTTCHRQVSCWPSKAVEDVLKADFVPVFHGDAVLDTKQGCTILSGDVIMQVRLVFPWEECGVFH
jgi:isopentenyl phosphate kinase